MLLDERPELAGTVRFDFYGNCDANSKRLHREFPREGAATFHGRISRPVSLAAMQETDVLVLIQNVADYSAETIPSKVYEYLAVDRPIHG